MLKWYLQNISHPWLKLSFPALAFLDCVIRNILDFTQISIDWTKGFLPQTAFTLWIFSRIWVALGVFYPLFPILPKQEEKRKKETLVYIVFLMLIITFFILSPEAVDIH